MQERYDYGTAVRVIRNIRNDGTFAGQNTGSLLIRRGSVGYVRGVGTFLQDQVIYEVHFMDDDRIVGCRQEELIPADAPWTPSRFETREKVQATVSLAMNGEVVVPVGTEGEVMRVLRGDEEQVSYHVHFPGHTLEVPERALTEVEN